jgi:histidinol dehydrogenase
MMNIVKFPEQKDWEKYCKRPTIDLTSMDNIVQEIFDAVSVNGDQAIRQYGEKFSEYSGAELKVSESEITNAESALTEALKEAIQIAYQNIYKFHAAQKTETLQMETMEGITCSRKSVAINSVGLYIPGGTAPLFSTVLMLGIPAQIAGCKNVQICTPTSTEGFVHPAILYAANLCGIKNIFKTGGIQAIAAMTLGTDTIKKSDKLYGPGNQYVAAAKQKALQYGVAADLPAGPSEVLVIADESADANFVASDLLAQAEHGKDSQVILLTNSESLIPKVLEAIEQQLTALPRREICLAALKNSYIFLLKDLATCMKFSNLYATEHLILNTSKDDELAEQVTNAGSVFIGKYTAESMGDYASGTNHTLPTNGFANSFSGVSLSAFQKQITFQKATEKGLLNIGKHVEEMAAAEGLDAHKQAITIRLSSLKKLTND